MAAPTNSSSRQRQVTIPANSRITVDFPDTKPNYFYLNNLSVSEVYLGVTMIPDSIRYDKMVGPTQETIFARDQGVKSIQLFNGTGSTAIIDLTTFEKEFDPAVLAAATAYVAAGGGGGAAFDGIIRGFTSALPAGDNNIGRVKVTEMPAITVQQGPLQEGTANIGKVQVTSLPSLPEGTQKIGNVGIQGGVTIDSMPPVQITNDPVRSSHHYYEASVGTTEIVYDMLGDNVLKFSYISNDDNLNALYLSFDDVAASTTVTNGKNKVIKLGPGEQLADFTRKATKVRMIRAAGTGNVRFLGV